MAFPVLGGFIRVGGSIRFGTRVVLSGTRVVSVGTRGPVVLSGTRWDQPELDAKGLVVLSGTQWNQPEVW